MASKSVRVAGFGVSVQVPDTVVRRLQRLLARPGGRGASGGEGQFGTDPEPRLVIRTPAPVVVASRDPGSALGWIEDRVTRRAGRRSAALTGDASADDQVLDAEVPFHPWYHTIDLPSGRRTPGAFDHRRLVPHYGIPEDLTGQRVLDIACADGFWSFEFERRGATVTALDIASTDDVDLPGPARTLARQRGLVDPLRDGLQLAHRLRRSTVELRAGSVYDLNPTEFGTFDLVHFGDLLIHLRDPLRALEAVRSVTGGSALFSDCIDPYLDDSDIPGSRLVRYFGGYNTACWWLPSLPGFAQWVADAGFSNVEVLTTYQLDGRTGGEGFWRAVLRAQP